MTDPWKGALLGISNLVGIMLCYGLAIGTGLADPVPADAGVAVESAEVTAWWIAVFIAPPLAVGFGVMLASFEYKRGPPWLRTATLVVLALMGLSLAAPLFPAMLPSAIPSTILHAILLARWTSSRIEPRQTPAGAQMGAILGACAALTIAVGAGASALFGDPIAVYELLGTPWFIDRCNPAAGDLFLSTLMHAMPIGILWGALTGWVADTTADLRWLSRVTPVFGIVAAMVVFVFIEPEVFSIVCPVALFYTLVLLRWTAAPLALARASLSRCGRRRSTSSRDARSRDPTPTPSDTSRTIRSA